MLLETLFERKMNKSEKERGANPNPPSLPWLINTKLSMKAMRR